VGRRKIFFFVVCWWNWDWSLCRKRKRKGRNLFCDCVVGVVVVLSPSLLLLLVVIVFFEKMKKRGRTWSRKGRRGLGGFVGCCCCCYWNSEGKAVVERGRRAVPASGSVRIAREGGSRRGCTAACRLFPCRRRRRRRRSSGRETRCDGTSPRDLGRQDGGERVRRDGGGDGDCRLLRRSRLTFSLFVFAR